MIVGDRHIVRNWRTGETHRLTREELDRFFDTRNPFDWIV